jgi:broad specificity phosphatase PhoE
MSGSLILVRHPEIADRYRGICYGRSDIDLSPLGASRTREIAAKLAVRPIARIVYSGVARTRLLAEPLSELCGILPVSCDALRERDYGHWELQSWDDIHLRHGDEMLKMVSEPATYRPGGGETTFELRDRILMWQSTLPPEGLTVAITHAGPIAALRGSRHGLPVAAWFDLIPACGESVEINFF